MFILTKLVFESYLKGTSTFLGLVVILVFLVGCAGSSGDMTAPRFIYDREGSAITVPAEIDTIVAIAPSIVEVLVDIGVGERIIAVDDESVGIAGLNATTSFALNIMAVDAEYIINLMPDIVFTTDMIRLGDAYNDPLAPLAAVGITVVYVPTSATIADIQEDIRFIANVMNVYDAGEELIAYMQAQINEILQTVAGIAQQRTVYFEISPAPWMFSFGTGTFLHEVIEIVGATNIFTDQVGWLPVTDEMLLERNPDIILTSTNYISDPIGEILARPGFGAISAVQNGAVFFIDTNTSSRPNHNIVIAMRQIAQAVFPEYFQGQPPKT